MLKGFLASTVGKVAAAAIVAAGVITVAVVVSEESFRTIAVEELNGITVVASEKSSTKEAYEGMHLYSGDDVTVQPKSDMTLILDMDKYARAEENTHFWLEAKGKQDNGKTVIHLEEGSVLNRIKNKLKEGEVYQVDTPNSTMAVRGTVFRVSVNRNEDGECYTGVEVLHGQVDIELKTLEGEYNGIMASFRAGEAAWIRATEEYAEFVPGEDGSIVWEIQYSELPQDTARKLAEFIDDGQELCIEIDLLLDYAQIEDHVAEAVVLLEPTCSKEGLSGMRCRVCNEVIEEEIIPKLPHTDTGEWKIVAEPDCRQEGRQERTCSVCGEVIETEQIPKTEHQPGEWEILQKPECEKEGRRIKKCIVCGDTLEEGAIPAEGHAQGDWTVVTESGCGTEGLRRLSCSKCGEILSTEKMASIGHSMGSWTVVANSTCTSYGKEQRSCGRCGYREERTIGLADHSMGGWSVLKEATCEEDGLRRMSCGICGYIVERSIPATGHKVEVWEEDGKLTCTTDGSRYGNCVNCGAGVVEKIPAPGHTWSEWKAVSEGSNGDAVGYMRICETCGHEEYKE